jgi:uncharacterized protein YbaA (DUF1428 family)
MAKYVDGYVIPLKKKNRAAYKKMAALGKKVWMEYGALDYYECIADDFAQWGLTFPKMCKLKKDETIIFAFVVYKSKAQRNKIITKVMSDPRMKMEGLKMPFDMNRFASAGCEVIVSS